MTFMRLGGLVVVLVLLGCERRTTVDAGAKALAPETPWQPHGFREPTLKCELAVPEGLERINPMPDLVELRSAELPPKVTIIVSERVEESVDAAVARVRAFHGSRTVTEQALEGGRLINARREGGKFESVALLALPGLQLIEVIGRFPDEGGKAQLLQVVDSLRCSKK